MTKTFKIDVDCPNCANKMECVVRKISMDGEEVSGTSEIRSKESVIARISLICHIF